jgi:tetratricopeptide (TPR) repeat protein
VEKTFPFDADVKTLRIWLEGERFRFENAQKILEESFSMSGSNSPDVVRAEGVMYVLGRDYERGTGALKKYLEFNAQDGIALFFLGRAAFESEKYTECVRFSKLSQLNSVGPLKLRAQTMMYRCRVLAQLGVDDALTEFGNFVSRFPRTSISREEYIRAMVDADRSQEAMKMAEQDVVDNPQSSSLKILLGDIYQKRGASNEALALFNEARKIDPRNARAALHIGDLFFKEERYKEAAQNYVDAAAQDPELPELYLKAARAYHLAGNFNEAEEMYFQEIKMRPAVLDTFLEAAEFLLESNRPSKVPDLFQEYGENFKSDPRVLTRLAQAYFAIGDSKNARVNAEIAVRLNPTEAEPYRILGSIFETQGQYPLAKSNYEKYILLVPQAPEVGDLKRKLALPPYVNE